MKERKKERKKEKQRKEKFDGWFLSMKSGKGKKKKIQIVII